MNTEGRLAQPLSRGRVLAITAVSLVIALLIIFGAVLPAEFNRDPLGLGRLTGLGRLYAPEQVEVSTMSGSMPFAHEYDVPYRTDFVEIPLAASGDFERREELEYKVRMRKGATLVYEWSVNVENPEEFYYDFHGHTPGTPEQMQVATYKQATGTHSAGSLIAPFDGVQGWFFQNQSVEPVVVRLKISGFYELVPPGEMGNEAGILANTPADQARVPLMPDE